MKKSWVYGGGIGALLLLILYFLLRKKDEEKEAEKTTTTTGSAGGNQTGTMNGTAPNSTQNATQNTTQNATQNGTGYNFSLTVLEDTVANASLNASYDSKMPSNASTGTVPLNTTEAGYNASTGTGYNSSSTGTSTNGGNITTSTGTNVTGGNVDIAGVPLETCAPVRKTLIGGTVINPMYTAASKLWPAGKNCPRYGIALPGYDRVNTPGNAYDQLPGEPVGSAKRSLFCENWRKTFNNESGMNTYSTDACYDPAKAKIEAAKDGTYLTIPVGTGMR